MRKNKELIEKLASLQHSIWSHWMRYLFRSGELQNNGSFLIPKETVEKWTRQINTRYEELSETEKESDRDQAKSVLKLLD